MDASATLMPDPRARTAAAPAPAPEFEARACLSLAALPCGTRGRVLRVGSPRGPLEPLERRLLELGFICGEQLQVLAETRPGRDPFVVRVGETTLAMRRREAESVWVEIERPGYRP